MRLRFLFALALGALLLCLAPRAEAQSPITASQSLEMNFPQGMRFELKATSASPIRVLRLSVWQRGVAVGSRYTPQFIPGTDITASYTWNFQSFSVGGYLPPGTHGEYTWHIEDAAGNTYDTPRAAYVVSDPTQKWQTLGDDALKVHWHLGDAKFGQAVLERAQSAHKFLAHELGIENVDPLEIFIYGDTRDFFASLPPFSYEWTGGRMFPEYGVIMIQFAPSDLEWGLRATSHELSHAILHSKIRGTIGELSIPHWLDEGLAVYNETDNHAPDEQFGEAFRAAVRRNTLIPWRRLQNQFPEDSFQAQLAYGQSYSAVQFLISKYGSSKFAELLNIYERGAQPDDGLVQVYGMNQDELENEWRKEIGAPQREISRAALPTASALPTYEFSSALTPEATSAPSATATPVPTQIAQAAAPDNAPTVPASWPALPVNGLCGGVLALGGFVGWRILRRRRDLAD